MQIGKEKDVRLNDKGRSETEIETKFGFYDLARVCDRYDWICVLYNLKNKITGKRYH